MGRLPKLILTALLSIGAAVSGSADENDSNDVSQTIVLAGASYVADWGEPDIGYTVVNRGVGGEETHEVLARFDRDVVALGPDIVLIWGHINNIHRAGTDGVEAAKERAISDYREMVRLAADNDIRVILATEVTLSEAVGFRDRVAALIGRVLGKSGYSDWVNEHVRDVNDWLRDYAAAEGILLLDFEQALDDGDGFRRVRYTSADGTHISPDGYAALTAYTRALLAQ